jgi:endonuclease/exonuclease/phosphatase family metal-dependent hydrolase
MDPSIRTVPESPDRPWVRVLTGNLLSGGVGRSRTEDRFDALMEVAAAQDADIACFQECLYFADGDHRLLHRAERVLGMRGLLGITPHDQHVAVFVREPLVVARHRALPDRVWHHGAVMAELLLPRDGVVGGSVSMTVVSAHLSPRSPGQRLLEAEQLVDYVRGRWAVIAGDMNTADPDTDLMRAPDRLRAALAEVGTQVPDVRAMTRLADAGFLDAASLVGACQETTGHWPGRDFALRPDRILLSREAAAQLRSVRRVEQVAPYSDHLWLTADVYLPGVAPDAVGGPESAVDDERELSR